MRVFQIALILLVFAAGFFAPDLFDFDKKMEFAEVEDSYDLIDCEIVEGRCNSEGYELELLDGTFATVERTTFKLTHNREVIDSDILVTSDDKQFGTLLSQYGKHSNETRQVLIPYCGNPIMHIILIDKAKNTGLLLTQKTSN